MKTYFMKISDGAITSKPKWSEMNFLIIWGISTVINNTKQKKLKGSSCHEIVIYILMHEDKI